MNDALVRAERRADRLTARDTVPTVDEYGQPGVLLERVERGTLAAPSESALLAQAALITEAGRAAKLLAEDEGRRALARARERRGGDVIDRARNRQGAFSRVAPRSQRAPRGSAVIARSGVAARASKINAQGFGHPCPGVGCDGQCGPVRRRSG